MNEPLHPDQVASALLQSRGSNVSIVWYFSSHSKMLFSFWRPGSGAGPNLFLVASTCFHYSGPLYWANSSVEIDTTGPEPRSVRLFDVSAGVELICGGVYLFYSAFSRHLDIVNLKDDPPPELLDLLGDGAARGDLGDI